MSDEEKKAIIKEMIREYDRNIKNINYTDYYISECKRKKEAMQGLLDLYEKEKEKNNKIDEFCRKELAFERRLQRENRQPDEFNQGRFYVSENIRKIIREE